jgi:hypothetical protein
MELALANELTSRHMEKFEISILLDELKVVVHLDISGNYSMWIVSEDTTDVLYEVEEEDEIRNVEGVARALEKTRTTLEQLYYYKPIGKFLLKEDKLSVLKYKVFKKFLNVEGCSICFEDTNVITHCNHFCCHKCMEKIKVCPICRRDLYD